MDVEKDMQEQFSEVQAALAQIPSHKISSDEAIKIHEMSQARKFLEDILHFFFLHLYVYKNACTV